MINYGLGIDTGGTYTDAVIVDLGKVRLLAKSKARTTHNDLSIGLGNAVDGVLEVIRKRFEPSLVGVSTTLATNTVLEKKSGKVGLIGLGWKPEECQEFGAAKQFFFSGGHDVRGRMVASLDLEGVKGAVDELAHSVDSIVVSGLFSVYNAHHELDVKRLISERCDLPVVMGHELTGELGIHERTVTAVLNAGLIPVLNDFLAKVQQIMAEREIKAPIMVFKGDGTLMNITAARKRPVDTLLSGPAASAMGGKLLSGRDDCLVIDMGGTSTDIAVIENGRSRITAEGAVIGTWPTRVQAVNARTVALGGDSEIRVSKKKEILIGPYRVTPLCFARPIFPNIVERMKETGETRFLMASQKACRNLSSYEQQLFDRLCSNGPQTFSELKDTFKEMYLIDKHVSTLWSQGAIEGIGLTPTDVLHAAGIYVDGDRNASELGLKIYSIALQTDQEELLKRIMAKVSTNIARELIIKVLSDEMGELPGNDVVDKMIDGMCKGRSFSKFDLHVSLKDPVIGLGGPAGAFISPLAELMDAEVLIPENFDVGNAIGAVCGQVSEFVDVFVYPRDNGYAVYSVFTTPIYYTFASDAVSKAKEMASAHALERAKAAGGHDLHVDIEMEEEREESKSVLADDSLLQVRVRARAVGTPLAGDDDWSDL